MLAFRRYILHAMTRLTRSARDEMDLEKRGADLEKRGASDPEASGRPGSARDHPRDNPRDGPSADFEDAASRIAHKLHGLAKGIRDEPAAPPPKPATVDLACLTGIPVEMLRAYLRAVASVGNVDAIKAVLTSDPLVIDSRDSSGWTALHHAARYGQMGARH